MKTPFEELIVRPAAAGLTALVVSYCVVLGAISGLKTVGLIRQHRVETQGSRPKAQGQMATTALPLDPYSAASAPPVPLR